MIPEKNNNQNERLIYEQVSEKIEPIVFSQEELNNAKFPQDEYMYYSYVQNFTDPTNGYWEGTYKTKNLDEDLKNNEDWNAKRIKVSLKDRQLSLGEKDYGLNFRINEKYRKGENFRIKSHQKQNFSSPFKKEWILSTDQSRKYKTIQENNDDFDNELFYKKNANYTIDYQNNEQKINSRNKKKYIEIQPRKLLYETNYLEKNNRPLTGRNKFYENINFNQNYNPQTTELRNNKYDGKFKYYDKLLNNENQNQNQNQEPKRIYVNRQPRKVMPKQVLYENSEQKYQPQGIEKYFKKNILNENQKQNQRYSYNIKSNEKNDILSGKRYSYQTANQFNKNINEQKWQTPISNQQKNLSNSLYSKISSSKKNTTKYETPKKGIQKLFRNVKNPKIAQSVKQILRPNKNNFKNQNYNSINVTTPSKKMLRNTFSHQDRLKNKININLNRNTSFNIPSFNAQKNIFQNRLSEKKGFRFSDINRNSGYNLNNTISTNLGLSPLLRDSLLNYKDENICSKIICKKFFESLDNGEISKKIFDSFAEDSKNYNRDSYYRFTLSKEYSLDRNNRLRCTLKSVNTGKNGNLRVSYTEIK